MPAAVEIAPGHYLVEIDQSNCDSSTEVAITGLPKFGRIMRFQSGLVSGSATDLRCKIRKASGATTNPDLVMPGPTSTSTSYDSLPNTAVGVTYYVSAGTLYYTPGVQGGSTDNRVRAELHIIARAWEI